MAAGQRRAFDWTLIQLASGTSFADVRSRVALRPFLGNVWYLGSGMMAVIGSGGLAGFWWVRTIRDAERLYRGINDPVDLAGWDADEVSEMPGNDVTGQESLDYAHVSSQSGFEDVSVDLRTGERIATSIKLLADDGCRRRVGFDFSLRPSIDRYSHTNNVRTTSVPVSALGRGHASRDRLCT